jgi:outer membrane lipoprotein LolB
MIATVPRIALIALIGALLAACAGGGARGPRPQDSPDVLAARARALADITRWTLEGRISVSDGRDSGSARLTWVQDGAFYTVTLRVPVSGQTYRLSGGEGVHRLEGVRPEPVLGNDPAELLARELGWHLPLQQMRLWAIGLADADARVALDQAGLPTRLDSQGWRVSYQEWDAGQQPALPRRVYAERKPYKVRIAVARWTVQRDGA